MKPPLVWLRNLRLKRAMQGYPMYDPPHKVEERLLSPALAAENFDYFMRVRLSRLAFFSDWLFQKFSYSISLDEEGVRTLSHWGNEYAGLLLVKGLDGYPNWTYFTYDPPWVNENVGHNVLLDMSIAFGEAILANCPTLRWEMDPISAILPNTAKLRKKTPGMSFQRPLITGFDNPAYEVAPLHKVREFAFHIMMNTTSFDGLKRFRARDQFDQRLFRDLLINLYTQTLKDYPEGDPVRIRQQMGPEQYLNIVDDEAKEDISDE